MPTFGMAFRWTRWDGVAKFEIGGCSSFEEAREAGLSEIKALGWTRPRWWEWWRWSDTNYERDAIRALKSSAETE